MQSLKFKNMLQITAESTVKDLCHHTLTDFSLSDTYRKSWKKKRGISMYNEIIFKKNKPTKHLKSNTQSLFTS